ncbi:MAG: DUF2269 family protein [Candidatus Limnocylindrales bacterium]
MYQALVFLHLLGVVIMAVAHGVSIFAAFRVRGESDPGIVAAVLGMSKTAVMLLYVGFLLMAVGGFGAAWQAGVLLAPWTIASYIVLVLVISVMYVVATPFYVRVRELASGPGGQAPDVEAMEAALATRRPEVLAFVGGTGAIVLLWLMVVRPG